MLQSVQEAVKPSKGRSLARSFSRLGWTGFWLQIVVGSLPIIGLIGYHVFSKSDAPSGGGFPFIEYLTIVNLLLLAFTTIWSYRYTRLARRIADPERRPSESSVVGTVWTGVVASAVGMLFSMTVMLVEAANLLFYFLKSPQAGMPVIQTSGTASVHWVSTIDIVSLMALILVTFAELVVLVFSLWLLFRTTTGSPEYPQTESA